MSLLMRSFNILFLLVIATNAFCQLAVVNDADGYVNIRSKADINSSIDAKIQSRSVAYCFEPNGNWVNVDYTHNGEILSGYIYKDRLKLIANFKEIKSVEFTGQRLIFKNDSLYVELLKSKFDSNKNKLAFDKNNGYKYLNRINGKIFFGTDGEIPKYQYKTITILIGRDTLKIPISDYNDLYEPNFYSTRLNYDVNNETFYLSASNSDGAGGYEVVWVIEKRKYKERYIYYGF